MKFCEEGKAEIRGVKEEDAVLVRVTVVDAVQVGVGVPKHDEYRAALHMPGDETPFTQQSQQRDDESVTQVTQL